MSEWVSIDEETTKMVSILGNQSETVDLLKTLNSALLVGVEPYEIITKLEYMKFSTLTK